jgi:hypothetical protein
MSIPVTPTAVSLVTEGLRQARIFNPTASQIATYQDEVMEQLKNDLWLELKQSKPLQTFSYAVLNPGQSRYSCPADYSSDMSMVIETGLLQGPVISGTLNTLTVPASVGTLDSNTTIGKDIAIVAGTASASVSQIISITNNGSTIVFTVYPNFQGVADSTSTFMIVDNQYPVGQDHIANFDRFRTAGLDRPRKFYPMGDENFDEFIFDTPPDAIYTYVIRMRYFVNIMTIDLSSNLMSTLYLKFRDYWIYGIKSQVLMDNDDTSAPASQQDRRMELQKLIMSQQYGTDLHRLTQHVEDYA